MQESMPSAISAKAVLDAVILRMDVVDRVTPVTRKREEQ
jgi:hypothetical protein